VKTKWAILRYSVECICKSEMNTFCWWMCTDYN